MEFEKAESTRISFIILNYNNAADTIECVQSILGCNDRSGYSIIVIDNYSTDNSYSDIKTRFSSQLTEYLPGDTIRSLATIPSINLIQNSHNAGYAGGNNTGLRFALQDEAIDFFWVLNNDTVLSPDCLHKVRDYLDQNKLTHAARTGIWGTMLLNYDKRNTLQALGAVYYPLWGRTKLLHPDYPVQEVDSSLIDKALKKKSYFPGASLLFSRAFLNSVGLFNEKFFLYAEEIDIFTRAKLAGWETGFISSAYVYHKEGSTTGAKASGRSVRSPFIEYHNCRSKLLYTRLYFRWYYPVVFFMVTLNLFRRYKFKLVYPFKILQHLLADKMWTVKLNRTDQVVSLK